MKQNTKNRNENGTSNNNIRNQAKTTESLSLSLTLTLFISYPQCSFAVSLSVSLFPSLSRIHNVARLTTHSVSLYHSPTLSVSSGDCVCGLYIRAIFVVVISHIYIHIYIELEHPTHTHAHSTQALSHTHTVTLSLSVLLSLFLSGTLPFNCLRIMRHIKQFESKQCKQSNLIAPVRYATENSFHPSRHTHVRLRLRVSNKNNFSLTQFEN